MLAAIPSILPSSKETSTVGPRVLCGHAKLFLPRFLGPCPLLRLLRRANVVETAPTSTNRPTAPVTESCRPGLRQLHQRSVVTKGETFACSVSCICTRFLDLVC